jgi:hypothetical protein
MFRTLRIAALVALAALAAAAVLRADDDDDKVPLDKLPKEVTAALEKKFPGAELLSAIKDNDDKDKPTYEVTIKFKKQELDVTLTPAGDIIQVEREIEVKEVPKVVINAIKKKYPKATFKGASAISKDDNVAEYELDIVTRDKKNLYVTFDKHGKFIYEEEVEESKDKDEAKDKKDK